MTKNVTWIIENYTKDRSFQELQNSVESLGYPLIKINGDFKKDTLKDFELKNGADPKCVIVNGSIKICKMIKDQIVPRCFPVTYSDFDKYKCSSYYSYYGNYLFNDKYCLMSLKELKRQQFNVWGQYGKDSVIFIRPDSGEKYFQAGLLDIVDLDKFIETNKDCEHDLVLASTPKNIIWEGRFVVSKHREIIAHSTYRYQGQVTSIPAVPKGSVEFCKELFQVGYFPDSVFCYDLCQDSDLNYWLMELTSFSSAGLYSGDKQKIVLKVSEIAFKDFEEHININY